MSDSAQMWMEIIFDLSYLIVIWALVGLMIARREQVATTERPLAALFIAAFGLLALGDTGHVGFRVLAYSQGNLNTTIQLGTITTSWVGLGALTTAVTVTLFYMLMVPIWYTRNQRQPGWFGWLLLATGIIRLIMLTLPINNWASPVPIQPWSTIRNIPLMIQGLGVAALILRDARIHRDQPFTNVGLMILVSYAFYLPVIFLVQQIPILGMLMIPKTLAYVAIAIIAYFALYRQPDLRLRPEH